MKNLVNKLKCFLGFHEWVDTGTRRMYGFIYWMKCAHCGKIEEMTPENISFENIGGTEIMVIRNE